ncbi:MAG: CDP-glycerol glycerophosphotransferase [Ruminococcaceae bacterium]|nr:CDP-glycerol glycerophosphotransferase [Oscillospiraceae bacterium]
MMAFIHTMIKYCVILCLYPLRLLPIKRDRIMLISDLNGKYSCNPKYLTEYLIEHYLDRFEVVYALSNPAEYPELPKRGVKTIKMGGLKYYIYAMTSGVFVTNSGGISFIPFRKKQMVINTWHGGGFYKKILLDYYPNTPSVIRSTQLTADKTDLFLVNCAKQKEHFPRALLIPKERLFACGSPRNDILFSGERKQEEIKNKIGLSGKKLCLYAPTFRRTSRSVFAGAESSVIDIDPEKTLEALKERFGGDWVFAFRYHPKIKDRKAVFHESVVDLSDYDDMQELLLAADVMINDYSSSVWDFAIQRKPCFLYATDIAEYEKMENFYIHVRDWPYPLGESMDELLRNIREFDEGNYRQAVDAHYAELGSFETGDACERLCGEIVSYLETRKKK